ncbi:hypothetical protein CVT26_015140 [Gymnopilus dilepis]|uniref:Uncharacterized protein n=1 Tax=Gymnopilus dilepis TaxID=231916 RepID=A0A409YEX8_9AGAR|nr:hypothetical protein CVT26_015140 [Gymnopilus dilepis]
MPPPQKIVESPSPASIKPSGASQSSLLPFGRALINREEVPGGFGLLTKLLWVDEGRKLETTWARDKGRDNRSSYSLFTPAAASCFSPAPVAEPTVTWNHVHPDPIATKSAKFALDAIYTRVLGFDFGERVYDGLHHALTTSHSADAIGDIDLHGLERENSSSDSSLTPLTSEDEGRPFTLQATSTTSYPSNSSIPSDVDASPHSALPSLFSGSQSHSTLPAITDAVLPSRAAKRKAQKKAASRRNAKKKKIRDDGYHPAEGLATKHTEESSEVTTVFDAQNFGISAKGYIGNRGALKKKTKSSGTYYLDQLTGPNSQYKFDLVTGTSSGEKPILDANGLVMGVCIGAPRGDESWEDVHQRAADVIQNARPNLVFDPKEKTHRRGKFPAVNVGISHGGGQPYPKVLEHSSHNEKVLNGLLEEKAFARISGFTTGAFATWAPRLYQYENKYLDDLIAHDEELRRTNQHPRPEDKPLRRNFPNTPWAATAFNFGPQTICYKHIDFGNLAFGWCVITALGNYDYKKGGHLILWDLKLVIEFPPGTSIMIPSCAIAHSNTRIQPGETRFSFTQYSSGGIFRWVDNGYKTVDAYMSDLDAEEKERVLAQLAKQLEHGLSLYSTLDELRDRKAH